MPNVSEPHETPDPHPWVPPGFQGLQAGIPTTGGAMLYTIKRISASYTATPADDVIICDAQTPTPLTLTFPPTASCPGKMLWVVPYGNPPADPALSTEPILAPTPPDQLWNVAASGPAPSGTTPSGKGQPFVSDGAGNWIGIA